VGDSTRLGASDCERLRQGRIAQPGNTATSAAYVVAGALVAARHGGPGAPRAGAARAYGGTLALVGAGSIAFHGPQPRGARWMHDLPIVAMVGLLVAIPARQLLRGDDAAPGWSVGRALALAGLSAGAVAAYAAGRTGARTCDPDSRWQWHGAWHVLTAAGFAVAADLLWTTDGGGDQ
jgi:hypothetical protein